MCVVCEFTMAESPFLCVFFYECGTLYIDILVSPMSSLVLYDFTLAGHSLSFTTLCVLRGDSSVKSVCANVCTNESGCSKCVQTSECVARPLVCILMCVYACSGVFTSVSSLSSMIHEHTRFAPIHAL